MSEQKPIAFIVLPRIMLATEDARLGIPEDIQEAVRSADYEPYVDDPLRPWGGNNVTSLVTDLRKAQVVIVDISNFDPYVMYGLGVAMTLRERVLLLFQGQATELPVLLSNEYCIFYANDPAGSRSLRRQLREAIQRNRTLGPEEYCNLVQRALPETIRNVLRDDSLLTRGGDKTEELRVELESFMGTIKQMFEAQPKGINVSFLERRTEQLYQSLKKAEDDLRRLAYERDTMLAQMQAHTLVHETQRERIVAAPDDAALAFVPAAVIVPGPPRASEEERREAERFVKAFYMDVTPVTNAQFERFVAASGYRTVIERENAEAGRDDPTWRSPEGPGSSIAGRADHPVVWVYREDARAYAAWAGRRLPTRLEWERAMRGLAGQAWPWGEQFDPERCNLDSEGTTPVGAHPAGASPAGCLDMVGNVWEWLADEIPGGRLVLIGGSWSEQGLKVGYKQLIVPADGADAATGFRCAMDG